MDDINNSKSNVPVSASLGPERGYIDILDEAILKVEEEQNKKGRTYNPLRPSSAGYCARKLAYQYQEFVGLAPFTTEEKQPNVIRLLSLGHFIESHIIKEFRKIEGMDLKYLQQTLGFIEYEDGTVGEGSMDLALQLKGYNGCVADAKSKGDKFSSYRATKWDQDGEAYGKMNSVEMVNERFFKIPDLDAFLAELLDPYLKANFYQLNIYATSKFLTDRKFDHASVIQYNKNDSRMREFRFRPSKSALNYVLDKFNTIKENPDKPEASKKEFNIGSMMCSYCEYASKCWPEVDTKKAFYATLPAKSWPKNAATMGDVGQVLERKYAALAEVSNTVELKATLEEEIVSILREQEIEKIRFSDGMVYTIKFLKSPRPHYELRRDK